MKLLTELILRTELKGKQVDRYVVGKDTIITPSARQFLKEKGIELVTEEAQEGNRIAEQSKSDAKQFQPQYVCDTTGGFFEKKPEYMTHLYGNRLVYKDHPRIEFRGKLDSLQSKLLQLQVVAARLKAEELIKDLEDILSFVRNILRAEVIEEQFHLEELLGLKEQEQRAQSHNPNQYFKTGHILPNYKMGEMLVELNALRTSVRETEIAGIKAFKKEGNMERQDILQALNRLSSAVYILMLRWQSGFYHKG